MGARFLTWMFTFVVVGLGASTVITALVDPTSYLTNAHKLYPLCIPGIRANDMRSKHIAAISFEPQTLLAGTSQISIGFDARDPVLVPFGRTYNFGISGVSIGDLGLLLRDIVPESSVSSVVLGVTYGMMIEPVANSAPPENIWQASFPQLRALRTALLSKDAFLASVRTIVSRFACATPNNRLDGTSLFNDPRPTEARFNTEDKQLAVRMRAVTDNEQLYRTRLAAMEAIPAFLCGRKIAVYIVILPNHVRRLEAWRQARSRQAMDRWKRDITEIATQQERGGCDIALWDFGYHNSVTTMLPDTNPSAFGYWESSHFKSNVGHRVLQRIFSQSDENFGIRLTSATIEEHLVQIEALAVAWRTKNPDVVADIARLRSGVSQ